MLKATVKKIFRSLGLISTLDYIMYRYLRLKKSAANKAFKKEFPEVPIPPDYILYEAHQIDYRAYYTNGLGDAKYLIDLFSKYISLEGKTVLDWGCGPSRVIRHFPSLIPSSTFYGCDYNVGTIEWNKNNIKNVTFEVNDLHPPTVFESVFFDAIYGLSIFTHLSEENHKKWIDELHRICAPNGIVLMTTHGEVYKVKLLKHELERFEANELVINGQTKEGHRTYTAYHPPKMMRQLFEERFTVLEHLPGKQESWGLSQDMWILKKK